MTTGADYNLPAEYADWVEKAAFTAHEFEPMVRIVTEKCTALYPDGSGNWEPLDVHTFVAPKPKPTLPDVKPGAVVRFRKLDSTRTNRAVKTTRNGPWIVLADDGMNWTFTGSEMFATFDMESAAIELDGLG